MSEKFEEPKVVIRSRKSKDRQHNDLQNNYSKKNKDRATRTPLKPGVNSEAQAVPVPHVAPVVERRERISEGENRAHKNLKTSSSNQKNDKRLYIFGRN
jgi:hypothetical protein